MFVIGYVLCSSGFSNSNLKADQYKQKSAPESRKIEIKIRTNPGLA